MVEGKLYVIGIGPGGSDQTTPRAEAALKCSSVVVGYDAYIDLLHGRLGGKRIVATGMRKEIDRCKAAVLEAQKGETVAVICSGDAGVYGMASLVLELCADTDVAVEVISGITAACSGAAILGAPLSHDFCAISLSDLLTPQELIERRIEAAAAADFCIALYNPMSHKRLDKLSIACKLLLKHRSGDTVCGWVRNIGREGEQYAVLTLKELASAQVDMFTTVFVGNSTTKCIHGKMVTPRGYEKKAEYSRND